MTTSDQSRPDAGERRQAILEVLAGTAEPLAVEDIADRLGVRPNTVRGHLEILLASGRVQRDSLPAAGRGRPRWVYRIATRGPSPYEFLARSLALHMSEGSVSAEDMAKEWLAGVPDHPPAATPEEAVHQAVSSLRALGFAADSSPLGNEIVMTRCPYKELVSDVPMICDIHGALLSTVLQQSAQDVDVESVDVWAKPGVCVAHLRRPDLKPERTITRSELMAVSPKETR